MTDQTQNPSDFSFRTFDIYRRFVEVLQCKPSYLQEFKTGAPKEETCLAVIKRVFQSHQDEEEINQYIQYFSIHAKMMAGHAEKLPDSWNDAISYTEKYIKEIRNYLRKKGISVRSDMDSVQEIAEGIAKHMHNNPTSRQIEAIRCYLKHDLRNPKRNVASQSSPKKKKSKKSSRSSGKSKSTKDKVVAKQQVVNVEKTNDESPTALEPIQAQLLGQMNKNENCEKIKEEEFEYIETEIVDDLFETKDFSVTNYKMDIDDSNNNVQEDMMAPGLNPSHNNYVEIEVEVDNTSEVKSIKEFKEVEQTLYTNAANSSFIQSNNGDEKNSTSNYQLKRKSSDSHEDDLHFSLKKQLKSCQRIPNNVNQTQYTTPDQPVCIKNNNDSSSDSEINVENDDGEDEIPMKRLLMMNRFDMDCESGDRVSIFDSENSEDMENIFNLDSQVRNLSYDDIIKHIDLVTTFCRLKNAIPLEELHILDDIRGKMYVKSLHERSSK